jgi:hypothetical protein
MAKSGLTTSLGLKTLIFPLTECNMASTTEADISTIRQMTAAQTNKLSNPWSSQTVSMTMMMVIMVQR